MFFMTMVLTLIASGALLAGQNRLVPANPGGDRERLNPEESNPDAEKTDDPGRWRFPGPGRIRPRLDRG